MVLTDGGVAHLRPIRPDDADAVVAFHQRQSPESLYYRYFSPKPSLTAAEVAHLTSVEPGRTMAFVAFDGDLLVGIGRYDHLRGGNEAELAFQADEAHRGRGLATIFLEYLIAAARESGLDGLVAEVLPDNRRMLAVFERAGFDACRQFADGVIEVELSLDPTDASRAAIEDREQRADARSVGRLLAPSAVAVIAGEGPAGDPARAAFDQLVAHEFAGPVVRVGEASAWTAPAHERIEDIPDAIDLAVVAVAPGALHATLAACAAKSVRGIVLLTPSAEAPADLVAVARRSGMRLIGPGALGVVNTAPDIRLHALPLAAHVGTGPIGFLSQSGSLAAALLQRAAVLGLGFSSVVSVGDKADLSANDLLQYWEHDDATQVVALYLQSFGNPRKFSRIARRVSRRKPDRGREERPGPGGHPERGMARRHARRPHAPDGRHPGRHDRGAPRRRPRPGHPAGARGPSCRGGDQPRGPGARDRRCLCRGRPGRGQHRRAGPGRRRHGVGRGGRRRAGGFGRRRHRRLGRSVRRVRRRRAEGGRGGGGGRGQAGGGHGHRPGTRGRRRARPSPSPSARPEASGGWPPTEPGSADRPVWSRPGRTSMWTAPGDWSTRSWPTTRRAGACPSTSWTGSSRPSASGPRAAGSWPTSGRRPTPSTLSAARWS